MKIVNIKYVIATTNFPLLFDDGNGNSVDDIEDAYLYINKDVAQNNLDKFDDDVFGNYQILPIKQTYEF